MNKKKKNIFKVTGVLLLISLLLRWFKGINLFDFGKSFLTKGGGELLIETTEMDNISVDIKKKHYDWCELIKEGKESKIKRNNPLAKNLDEDDFVFSELSLSAVDMFALGRVWNKEYAYTFGDNFPNGCALDYGSHHDNVVKNPYFVSTIHLVAATDVNNSGSYAGGTIDWLEVKNDIIG